MSHFFTSFMITCSLLTTMYAHSADTTQEHPFVIVIYADNATNSMAKNLASIFCQNYTNYRVIYIANETDIASARNFVQAKNQEHRYTFINNHEDHNELATLYAAVHTCADDEIILPLRATDWLVHDNVLTIINNAYTSDNVWFTYGIPSPCQTINPYCRRPMPDAVVSLKCYREYDWEYERPYSFYAGLFKQLRLEDMINKTTFFQDAIDMAYVFPFLEMTEKKFATTTDFLYASDKSTIVPTKNKSALLIRSQKRYAALKDWRTKNLSSTIALVLFADAIPRATNFLTSAYHNLSGIGQTYIFYRGPCDNAYEQWKKTVPDAHVIPYAAGNDLARFVTQTLESSKCTAILFAHDACRIITPCDLTLAFAMLNRTHAYGCYLTRKLDNKTPPSIPLEHDMCTWKFSTGAGIWRISKTFSCALYPMESLSALKQFYATSWKELEMLWAGSHTNVEQIGLFFETAKARP